MKVETGKAVILFSFLIIILIILGGVEYLALTTVAQESNRSSVNLLHSINQYKKSQLSQFLVSARTDMEYLANNTAVSEITTRFIAYKNSMAFNYNIDLAPSIIRSGAAYKALVADAERIFRPFCKSRGLDDLYLITMDTGRVIYTLENKGELGLNLLKGNHIESGLAALWRSVKTANAALFADYNLLPPLGEEVVMLLGAPIAVKGEATGLLVFPVPVRRITGIMQQRIGLGATGESYLVGGDKRMRSDALHDPNKHSISASFHGSLAVNGMDTFAVESAFRGGKDKSFVTEDYAGNRVIAAWDTFKIDDITWAIVTEMDLSESSAYVKSFTFLMIIVAVIVFIVAAIIFTSLLYAMIRFESPNPQAAIIPPDCTPVTIEEQILRLSMSGKIMVNGQEVKFKEVVLKKE